ncbi:MAG: type II toxin-antitoxin system VapC family toxin [Bryobacterales bacterium]|nr:type II toxin-antitoxin system VapC family toxin [Bryobacterales bacterium]
MKPRVYVETSVVSYLTARLSRDVVVLGKQIVTREWWPDAADRFEPVTSELVLEEASEGDPRAAAERLAVLESTHILDVSDDSRALGRALLRARAMPTEANQDAAHIAVAVVHGVDFLATWKVRHIANPTTALLIKQVCRDAGYDPITICTPSQLMEASPLTNRLSDPIVDEVRAIRAKLAARAGNDIDAIITYTQAMQRTSGRSYVRSPARRLARASPATSTVTNREQKSHT